MYEQVLENLKESGIPLVIWKDIANITSEFSRDSIQVGDILIKRRFESKEDLILVSAFRHNIPRDPKDYSNLILIGFKKEVNRNYIYEILKSDSFIELIIACKVGIIDRTISLDKLRSMSLPLPSYDLQEKIINQISKLKKVLKNLNQGIQKCKSVDELLKNNIKIGINDIYVHDNTVYSVIKSVYSEPDLIMTLDILHQIFKDLAYYKNITRSSDKEKILNNALNRVLFLKKESIGHESLVPFLQKLDEIINYTRETIKIREPDITANIIRAIKAENIRDVLISLELDNIGKTFAKNIDVNMVESSDYEIIQGFSKLDNPLESDQKKILKFKVNPKNPEKLKLKFFIKYKDMNNEVYEQTYETTTNIDQETLYENNLKQKFGKDWEKLSETSKLHLIDAESIYSYFNEGWGNEGRYCAVVEGYITVFEVELKKCFEKIRSKRALVSKISYEENTRQNTKHRNNKLVNFMNNSTDKIDLGAMMTAFMYNESLRDHIRNCCENTADFVLNYNESDIKSINSKEWNKLTDTANQELITMTNLINKKYRNPCIHHGELLNKELCDECRDYLIGEKSKILQKILLLR
ncbi:MAG: hypothetical protein ACE5J3_11745, partial [Methanosarcinales archaeon]